MADDNDVDFTLPGGIDVRHTSDTNSFPVGGFGDATHPTFFTDVAGERTEIVIGDPSDYADYLWSAMPADAPRIDTEHAPAVVAGQSIDLSKRDDLLPSTLEQIGAADGRTLSTMVTWLPQTITRVRCGRAGLSVVLTGAAPAVPLLPLRNNVLHARLMASPTEHWEMVAHWDAATRTITSELAFPVAEDGLRQRVIAVLQRPEGATFEVRWVHALILIMPADGGDAPQSIPTSLAQSLPRNLAYAAGSDVYESLDGWRAFVAPGGTRRLLYGTTARPGVYQLLPSELRLGLQADGRPFAPSLSLRAGVDRGARDDDYRVALSLRAVPWIDPRDRELVRAAAATDAGATTVALVPAADLTARCSVDAPAGGATAIADSVDIASGFGVHLEVAAPFYSLLVEQLLGPGILGHVDVTLDQKTVQIPLNLSLLNPVCRALTARVDAAAATFTADNPLPVAIHVDAIAALGVSDRPGGVATQPLTFTPPFAPPFDVPASRSLTVPLQAATKYDRAELWLDGERTLDPAAASPAAWAEAVHRSATGNRASYPLTVDIVNYAQVLKAAPALKGVYVTVTPLAAPERAQSALVTKEEAGFTVDRTLAELAQGGQPSRYTVELGSVFPDRNGLTQRVSSQSSVTIVRALADAGAGHYDVIAEDGTTLATGLDRDTATARIATLRASGACWTVRFT